MCVTYEPLDTLKSIGSDIWIVDGPAISFYKLPFSTRMTVVRLENGSVWVHSPIRLTEELALRIEALGPIVALIAPNWIHYAYVNEWKERFPDALIYAAPGVEARAKKHGLDIKVDVHLGQGAETAWHGEISQMIVEGSKIHREAVFFHDASKTLILTDLIENFEPHKLPLIMRFFVRLAGLTAPNGKMPPDMRASFRGNEELLKNAVVRMINWRPHKIVVAHGKIIDLDAIPHLRRAFASVLD